MDDFDFLNQPVSTETKQNVDIEDDLFGSNNTDNMMNAPPVNTFNMNQDDNFFGSEQSDMTMKQDATNTFNTNEGDIFGSGTVENTVTTDIDQHDEFSWTIENSSLNAMNLAPTEDNIVYNSSTKQLSDDTSSYEMFPQEISTGSSSMEHLSPLEAFNIRRQKEIAAKDVEEQRKINELREQAKNDLNRWYQERQKRMEQKLETIKHDEECLLASALEKSAKETCDWAKVIRFLEFNAGTQLSKGKRDLSRMKGSIIAAKRDKDAGKSANGVQKS